MQPRTQIPGVRAAVGSRPAPSGHAVQACVPLTLRAGEGGGRGLFSFVVFTCLSAHGFPLVPLVTIASGSSSHSWRGRRVGLSRRLPPGSPGGEGFSGRSRLFLPSSWWGLWKELLQESQCLHGQPPADLPRSVLGGQTVKRVSSLHGVRRAWGPLLPAAACLCPDPPVTPEAMAVTQHLPCSRSGPGGPPALPIPSGSRASPGVSRQRNG